MRLSKTDTFIGGILGLITFLIYGLLPGIVYGGFLFAALFKGLTGHPIDGSWSGRLTIVSGMLTGVLATAGIFVVSGAILVTMINPIIRRIYHARTEGDTSILAGK